MSIWEVIDGRKACRALTMELSVLGMFTCYIGNLWASGRAFHTAYFKINDSWNEHESYPIYAEELICRSSGHSESSPTQE